MMNTNQNLQQYKNYGAQLVDATQPIKSVVDEILSTLD